MKNERHLSIRALADTKLLKCSPLALKMEHFLAVDGFTDTKFDDENPCNKKKSEIN